MATKAERAAAAKARRAAKKAAAAAAAGPDAVDTETRTSPSTSAAPSGTAGSPEIVNSATKKQAKSPARNDGPAERAARTAKVLAKEAEDGTVLVRATAAGVYVGRRKEGEEFEFPISRLQEKDGRRVLPSWMELVEKKA